MLPRFLFGLTGTDRHSASGWAQARLLSWNPIPLMEARTQWGTGIVFGSIAVSSVSYVWIRHRVFGFGGGILSITGVALLGLSIWSSIKIEFTESGLRAEFDRLAMRVDEVAEASQTVTEEVSKIGKTAQAEKGQFVELAKVMEAKGVVTPAKLKEIQKPFLAAPAIDVERLDKAMARLKRGEQIRPIRRP